MTAATVTAAISWDCVQVTAAPGVYTPQRDSHLLVDALGQMGTVGGRTTVDLCTGRGVVAIGAARLGAVATAWNIYPDAVQCARSNVAAARVPADILWGSVEGAIGGGGRGRRRPGRVPRRAG